MNNKNALFRGKPGFLSIKKQRKESKEKKQTQKNKKKIRRV